MSQPRRWTAGRIFGIGVALSVVGVWGYVMYLTFFEGRDDPRDRMTDVEYREEAEATCAPYRERIDALPLASQVSTPQERADMIDAATAELRDMVADLETLDPPAADDEAQAVSRWLDDWEIYLDDRDAYADRFRQGIDEAFRMTDAGGGEQINAKIDNFAHINYMESCETPKDVG